MVKIYTQNCNGIGSSVKRLKMLKFLKNKSEKSILLLQETHSCNENRQSWFNEMHGPKNCFLNHGESNARGVAILFNNVDFTLGEYYSDGNGRLQLLSVKIDEFAKKILLINIYAPNSETLQIELLKKLSAILDDFKDLDQHHIICGGDFNLFLDKTLDTHGGLALPKKHARIELLKICVKHNLIDIFRVRNPNLKKFSYEKKTPKLYRRLDFFIISGELDNAVTVSDIEISWGSDHSPVVIGLSGLVENTKGPSLWKFNSSLCTDLAFNEKMVTNLGEWYNKYEMVTPTTKWDLLKFESKGLARDYSIKKAKKKKN